MDTDPIFSVITLIVVVAVALWVARRFCAGVARMFRWATKGGILRAMVMILLWASLFPVMAFVAIVIGDE